MKIPVLIVVCVRQAARLLRQARANDYGTLFLYTNARAELEVAAGR